MEDYRLDQSGQEVQDILNGAAMQVDLTAETERATEAEQTLQGNIDAEATRAQGAEGTLQDNIDAEEARAKAAEKQNADDIDAIEEKIPSGASSSNKLATEEYVADAVATATATFRGTYNLVSDLHLNVTATEQQISAALAGAISTADNNDYCFILVPTSSETPTEIKEIDRYKFNGTAWAFEYKLNNSGFNAAQWAAINSGITSGDVAKLAALPTNAQLTTLLAGLQSDIDGEETRAKAAELAIQGNIDAEEVRAKAAEKQNADDIDAIEAVLPESASSENKVATESEINSLSAAIEAILLLIPSAATSLNKLADKAFVNSSIATATATFRGTYNLVNDLGLTTSATHAQIATALAGAILTADNNDYAFVQIPTSDAMPTEIAKTERYKFNGTAWEYEYDLNNSGFTADQWAAINSGITQALVTKLSDLPTNAQLTTELGTLTSSITAINQKIPNAASQANKLVDTAAMESYIVQVLDVLTASFNVTSTDGHVTVQISQVDGKITSVAVSTSDIASAADLNLKASQADLTALASRVTTAEGNITTLGGRMTTAEGNITSLGGRMTTAEGNITTINGNITSLGGRVSTNETDISNLQQLYNDLQQSKPVPVTALPETGQQQGVIYRLAGTTSYSDYMWNGSTWVLMATYNNAIDPRPKKASQNLVTSGGVFDNMGALDVSELNATENPHTLAKYVDLSAALAAIPTDYQKGGMSIKYVCSSDNNYVQYRYIGTEVAGSPNPFLDVANWQKQEDIDEGTFINIDQYEGVVLTNTGNTTVDSTVNISGNIPVNGDEILIFSGAEMNPNLRTNIGGWTSDDTFVRLLPARWGGYVNEVVQIPSGVVRIRVCSKNAYPRKCIIRQCIDTYANIVNSINSINGSINNIEYKLSDEVTCINDVSGSTTVNYEVNFVGGKTYIITNTGKNAVLGATLFNGVSNLEQIFSNLEPNTAIEYTPSVSAKYTRVSWNNTGSFTVVLKDSVDAKLAEKADKAVGTENNILVANGKRGFKDSRLPIESISINDNYLYSENVVYADGTVYTQMKLIPGAAYEFYIKGNFNGRFNLLSLAEGQTSYSQATSVFDLTQDWSNGVVVPFIVPSDSVEVGCRTYEARTFELLQVSRIIPLRQTNWKDKIMAFWGDSVTQICNGDYNPVNDIMDFSDSYLNRFSSNWTLRVGKYFNLKQIYARGIGGQTYCWNKGGIVTWVTKDTGKYVGQSAQYNYAKYLNPSTHDAVVTEIEELGYDSSIHNICAGSLSSWSRITSMFPESIKDTIDCVVCMCLNDTGSDKTTDAEFITSDNTDIDWYNSTYYSTFGGDYNLSTLKGAIASMVMKLQSWLPNAVIVICSPISGTGPTDGSKYTDLSQYQGRYDLIAPTLEIAERLGLPTINMYKCGINGFNRDEYIRDGTHPYSVKGSKMVARAMIGGLTDILPLDGAF